MNWFRFGAFLCFFGVTLGAFGAHGLKAKLGDFVATFEVGVRYQIYHGLALIAVHWANQQWPGHWANWAGWCFVVGTFVFSGSLYVLSITGIKTFGAITPLGGLTLLVGWVFLILAAKNS